MADSRGTDFDDFVRMRTVTLLRVAYLLTGDRHAAEDLLQEVLEQVYVRWRRVRTTPEAYARQALVNRAASRWRRRRRRPESALAGIDPGEPDSTERVLVRDTMVAALRDLPYRQRAAVASVTTTAGARRPPSPTRRRNGHSGEGRTERG